jgi:hypothetical protein
VTRFIPASDWKLDKKFKNAHHWALFDLSFDIERDGFFLYLRIRHVSIFRVEAIWLTKPMLFIRLMGLGGSLIYDNRKEKA